MELNSNSINDDFIVPVNIEDNLIEFSGINKNNFTFIYINKPQESENSYILYLSLIHI